MVDLVKDKVEVYRCRRDVCLDEVYKDINEVGVHSGTIVVTSVENGYAYVARDGIWLGWWWRWGMVLGGDRLGVEFVDNVDIGVVDGGNRGGGCSCDGSAKLVGVSSALGSLVVSSQSRGCVL